MVEFQTQFKKAKVENEYFEPDTSETEPGQAQSVEFVLDKCLRDVPPRQKNDALVAMALSGVEVGDPNHDDLLDAFGNIDVTQSSDFDLADVSAAQQLVAQIEASEFSAGRSSEQLTNKASEERDLKAENEASSQLQKE